MTERYKFWEENEESVVVLCPIEGEVAINCLIGEMRVVEWGRADHSLKIHKLSLILSTDARQQQAEVIL